MAGTERVDVKGTLPQGARAPGDTTRKGADVLPLPGQAQEAERIGGYRVVRELGRGGMGVVWLAESLSLGRQVALKVLTAQGDVEAVERFLLEARAAARLRHPNVVGVHEVGRDGARWFLALELVDGESLRARVQRDGPLPPEAAAALLEPIARALHHAHGAGLLHRDVKPANVLVARDGTPLLADFGLAKDVAADGVTVTGEVMGTPAYMAPEQAAADHARVDRRADVYGLGATLYEALTGRPPFQGGSALAVLRQVADAPPTPPSRLRPAIDRDLEAICLACLEKAPGARYDTALALAEDLARWRRHEPVSVRPPGAAGRALRRARRRPGLTAGAGAAAVALLATGSAALALRLDGQRRLRETRRAAEAAGVAASESGLDLQAQIDRAIEARAAAREWRDAAPDDGQARARLGESSVQAARALRAQRQYAAAEEAYAEGAKLLPGRDDLARAARACERIHEGEQLRMARRSEAALEAFAEAVEARPDWPDGWVARAIVHDVDGDFPSELRALDEALRVDPKDAVALHLRSLRLLQAGDVQGALRDLDEEVRLVPDAFHARLLRAGARRQVRAFDEALADVDRALELSRGSAAAHMLRSQILLERGDPTGALATLEAAAAGTGGEDARLWAQLGGLRLSQGGDALAALDRAVALDPGLGAARMARAHTREGLGDLRGALEDLDALNRSNPADWSLLTRRGHVRALAGDLAGAEADFDRAVRTSTGSALALQGRAEVRLVRGDPRGAAADATAALAFDPDAADAYRIRGQARLRLGEDGAPDLERFLSLVPSTHPRAAQVRDDLARARR